MNKITISTDKNLLDIPMIHQFLSNRSYWAKGRSLETVTNSIENSMCVGVYLETGKQIGFARIVTDYAIFGWIMDVFILEEYRGKAYGKQLMNYIVNCPELKNLGKMGLATADAHGLYKQSGFTGLAKPENAMELVRV
jgi:GNAT superfamily N-acetyltransferase